MPTWDKTKPDGTIDTPSDPSQITDNWDVLEDAVGREHIFDGDGSSDEGDHKIGECGVISVGTLTEIDALADVLGGIAFATDYWDFVTNNGAGWIRRGAVPAGTKCIFFQDTAPTGWQIDTSLNDKCVLIDSNNGGTTTGSWTISGLTHSHTHTYSDVPRHRHTFTKRFSGATTYDLDRYVYDSDTTIYTGYTGETTCTSEGANTNSISSGGAWRPAAYAAIVATKL